VPFAALAPPPPAPDVPERSVPLARAPRAVAQLVHLASERGISRARLTLRPAELGGIEIRLQASASGVAAQLVAESPEAARLLESASDDLRRSLARQDVTLLSLDVSTSGEDRREAGGAPAGFDGDRPAAGDRGGAPAPAADPADLDSPTEVVVELPDGVLVDVLA
jgi:flagellar hook-length control protein FliK